MSNPRAGRAVSSAALAVLVTAASSPLSAGSGQTSPGTPVQAPTSTGGLVVPPLGWTPSTTSFDGQTIDRTLAEKLAGGAVAGWGNCSAWESADGTLSATSGTGLTKHPCVAVVQTSGTTATEWFVSQTACQPRETGCLGGRLVDMKVVSQRQGLAADGWDVTFDTKYKARGRRVKDAPGPLSFVMEDLVSVKLSHGTMTALSMERRDGKGAVLGAATVAVQASAVSPSSQGDCYGRAEAAGRIAAEPWEQIAKQHLANAAGYAGLIGTDSRVATVSMDAEMGSYRTAYDNAQLASARAFEASYQQCMQEAEAALIEEGMPIDKAPTIESKDSATGGATSGGSGGCATSTSTSTVETTTTTTAADGSTEVTTTTSEYTTTCGAQSDGSCGCVSSGNEVSVTSQ